VHTPSPSQMAASGTISKAPAQSTGPPTGQEGLPRAPWTQAVQGNNKLHFMVKGFYLSPCHCELIEKIISPHNASLMKSDGTLVTRCQPF